MDAVTDGRAVEPGFCNRPAWILVLIALVAGQVATTLTLFGEERSWKPLLDSRPITSGKHALHYYHGILGAKSWRSGNFGAAYDPAFQAGYPKTPVFDSGSRPAEFFMLWGKGHPAAYKLGLALCCMAVPLVFAGSARLMQLGPGTACLSALLGQIVWWCQPVQSLVQMGQIDWLLAGQAVLLHAALLVRFHHSVHIRVWLGLFATAAVGWFCHPILWLGFAALFVPLYLAVALKHTTLWNLSLWAAWLGGLAVNLVWLIDWARFCWISMPITTATSEGVHQFADWWNSAIWGERHDRILSLALFAAGAVGVIALLVRRQSAAALTLGAAAMALPAMSAGSNYWKPLEHVGVSKLLVLGLAFAAVAAAAAAAAIADGFQRLVKHPAGGVAISIGLLVGLYVPLRHELRPLALQSLRAQALPLGLREEQEALIQTLRASTSRDSRILFEERATPNCSWTPLLPMRCDRGFLGGLDSDGAFEHAFARLTPKSLAGRPFAEWSDAELEQFCRRYNVGHIVCWSPDALTRFSNWAGCEPSADVFLDGAGKLFTVKQPSSLVLKGKAKIDQIVADRIALNAVEPEDGVVVLSLHYQEGWRVSPTSVTVEPEHDPYDPIPFMRLRCKGPVMRLTLVWEGK